MPAGSGVRAFGREGGSGISLGGYLLGMTAPAVPIAVVFTVSMWLPVLAYLLNNTVGWRRAVAVGVVGAAGVAIWVGASFLPEGKPCNSADCMYMSPG